MSQQPQTPKPTLADLSKRAPDNMTPDKISLHALSGNWNKWFRYVVYFLTVIASGLWAAQVALLLDKGEKCYNPQIQQKDPKQTYDEKCNESVYVCAIANLGIAGIILVYGLWSGFMSDAKNRAALFLCVLYFIFALLNFLFFRMYQNPETGGHIGIGFALVMLSVFVFFWLTEYGHWSSKDLLKSNILTEEQMQKQYMSFLERYQTDQTAKAKKAKAKLDQVTDGLEMDSQLP